MELSINGNGLNTLISSINCLARVGNELIVNAFTTQLRLHTLNAPRSAYQCITFQPSFFNSYAVSGAEVHFSVLLEDVCSVLRNIVTSVDHISVQLPDQAASKVKWTLVFHSGKKETYWITCNMEPDIQQLSIDRNKFPSSIVVHPRNLSKLLGKFQSSLQEITVFFADQTSFSSGAASEIGGKAVEFRSYVDLTKDGDSLLPTQICVDPSKEFLQYTHAGDAVDITFSLKELKAFLSFCEACEADIHLFFEKAGEPILIAPIFGLGDGSSSSFDATLVLATMLVSQLQAEIPTEQVEAEHPFDHTRVWSQLSVGSVSKSVNYSEERPQAQGQSDLDIQRIKGIEILIDQAGGCQASIGGKPKRQNQQAQAKQHAEAMRKAEVESSSRVTKEPTFQEIFGLDTIRKDWSSGIGQFVGLVIHQGDKDICWAICFARLLQAIYNIAHPTDQITFSHNELVSQIKPNRKKGLALSNLERAFKHIRDKGILKMTTKGHEMAGDKGKKVKADFNIYEDVNAQFIQQRLDRYPVALRLEIHYLFSSNHGEIYYLPQKNTITDDIPLHLILLIGYCTSLVKIHGERIGDAKGIFQISNSHRECM